MALTNCYVTLAQFKDHMGIADSLTSDAEERALNATCRAIDAYCKRRFWVDGSVTAITYQADSPTSLYVKDIAATTGLIVKTDTANSGTFSTTWTITTDFVLKQWDKDRTGSPYHRIDAVGGYQFPTSGLRERVQVTALHGWTAVPDEVAQAALIKAARVFRRKDSPEGIAGGFELGAVRISRFEDPDVCQLLAPLVRGSGVTA